MMYIYVLIDPRNLEIRYVGKTNDLKKRMRAHISPHVYMRHNNKKCIWIEQLKAIGLKPLMQVLCKCNDEDSQKYEYFYYRLFKKSCDLLNAQVIAKDTYQLTIWR